MSRGERIRPLRLAPALLAFLVTLVNAAKPVAIDDAAYLSYARQIAQHPLDPYGFTLFWYTVPDPAFEILAPPVIPYWLALGVRLLGDSPPLLKLWMFPFVYLFAASVAALLRRFGLGSEGRLLPVILLSPAVLPTVNLMLDIPAQALGLGAVVLFLRATDRGSWRLALAAGIIAGLAMQTKYTALLIPAVMGVYAISRRNMLPLGLWMAAVVAAASVFAGWEGLMLAKYGQSHFAYHAGERQPSDRGFLAFLMGKSFLAPSLAGQLGGLGIGIGVVAVQLLGVPRRMAAASALLWLTGFAWIVLAPARWNLIPNHERPPINAATLFWVAFGVLVLLSFLASAVAANLSFRPRLHLRRDSDAQFLAAWLLIELVGYFVLTPFGAARRVIGLVVVGGLLAAWLTARMERVRPARCWGGWLVGFGVAAGVLIAALDAFDAFPEKNCAERAAAVAAAQPHHGTVWFAGHWGFQYYCERAGMRQVAPGQSTLERGDLLVLPVYPDDVGFYRPHIGSVDIAPPPEVATPVAESIADDFISGQTIPNFYCGIEPVIGRDAPRLRVVVYRMDAPWSVPYPDR